MDDIARLPITDRSDLFVATARRRFSAIFNWLGYWQDESAIGKPIQSGNRLAGGSWRCSAAWKTVRAFIFVHLLPELRVPWYFPPYLELNI